MSQEQRLEQLIQRLETVLERLEKVQPGGKAAVTGGAVGGDPKVEAYDEYVATHLTPLLKNCRDIGGDLSGLADLIEKGFAEVRNIVVLASKSKKPSDDDFGSIVQPLAGVLQQITEYKDKRRGTDFYNHEYAVAEGIQCLAWVTVPNTPVAYTKEMVNAAQFYNNKVLTAYKGKDQRHLDFVAQFKTVIEELANYIKEHHTTGLSWNNKTGGDWKSAK